MASTPSETAHYLDSSALIKLVVDEPETEILVSMLGSAAGIVSSEIALVEVPRAVQRLTTGLHRGPREAAFAAAESLLRGIAYIPVSRELLVRAGRFEHIWLRSLDAIHLASVLSVADDVELFITYDRRQQAAGTSAKLEVAHPGQPAEDG